jgi:DNA-binding NtrC family response regulator
MTIPYTADSRKDFDALVADDDPGVRELLADFLKERGLDVAATADGRAAVAALARSAGGCRLVFTDIAMPGADGFAVLMAARAANPNCYVVMITGYGSLETAIHAVRLGAQDYLAKPFSLGQVDVILRQAAARFSLETENRTLTERPVTAALMAIDDRLTSLEYQLRKLTSLLDPTEVA